jgi:hypothetical protein
MQCHLDFPRSRQALVEACFSKTGMGTHPSHAMQGFSSINRRYHTTSYYSYRSQRGNRAHGLASRDGLSRIAFVIEYSVLEARGHYFSQAITVVLSYSDAEMSVLIPNAIRFSVILTLKCPFSYRMPSKITIDIVDRRTSL